MVVQVAGGADEVLVVVAMNDVLYAPPALPPRHDRFVSTYDLKAEPELGAVITGLEAAAAVFAPPWVPFIFDRDVLTDAYNWPQALSEGDAQIHTTASGGQDASEEDQSQPFPIYGWLSVRWKGRPVVEWENWEEVGGGGATDAALTATNYGGRLYLFSKHLDGHVYVNNMDEAVGSWDGWTEVPGEGTTHVALASEVGPDDRLYLFSKGINDQHVYLNVLNSSEVWSGWFEVPGGLTTNANLSATTYGRRLYLFAKERDSQQIQFNMLDFDADPEPALRDLKWIGWQEVPGGGTTDVGLTSAVGPDGRLYLIAKGIDDQRVYQNMMDPRGAWTGWYPVTGDGTTDVSLGVTRYGSRLFLFGKGIDDRGTYLNTMEATCIWSGWSAMPDPTTTIASLNASGGPDGKLYVFRVSDDRRIFFLTNRQDVTQTAARDGSVKPRSQVSR
ncbi:hypothetical protein WI37_08420 [Burkholderia ubonensis]|nr:hypothetical protein WI37_08420 [Burkholderia ubonensis]